MNRCVHFNGIQNPLCKAGIDYDIFRQERVDGKEWLPCIEDGICVHCEHRRFPTAEEVDAEQKIYEKSTITMLAGFAAVSEDAEKNGLKKGKGGSGEVACPVCEGTIKYSVANSNSNGHKYARCQTENCVSFME